MEDRPDYIFSAVLQNASLLAPEPTSQLYARIVGYIFMLSFGISSNLLAVVALVKSGLIRRVTYCMILSLSMSDTLLCLALGFPPLTGAFAGR